MNKTQKFAGSLLAVVLLAMPITLFAQTEEKGQSETEFGVDLTIGTLEKVPKIPIPIPTSPSDAVEKATGIPLSYGSVAEGIAEAAGAEAMKGPIGSFVDATLNSSSIATDSEEGSPGTMKAEKRPRSVGRGQSVRRGG